MMHKGKLLMDINPNWHLIKQQVPPWDISRYTYTDASASYIDNSELTPDNIVDVTDDTYVTLTRNNCKVNIEVHRNEINLLATM